MAAAVWSSAAGSTGNGQTFARRLSIPTTGSQLPPYDGDVFAQALATLAGVVSGGVLAFAATFTIERAKWGRTQSVRWDEHRLASYVEYSNCIRRMQVLSHRIVASRGLPGHGEPLSPAEGLPLLVEAEAARSVRWQEVLLLGGAGAIEVGYELNRCAWVLEWFARGKLADANDWMLAVEEIDRLRLGFYSAARTDMGIKPSDLVALRPSGWSPEAVLGPLRGQPSE